MKICPLCGKEYSDTSRLCPLDAGVLEHAQDPLLGQTLAGKYFIEKLIKHGGMGSVYLGKHVLMDKTVAIKVLRPSLALDNDVVARFSREAKAASRINHPHAVVVTDFGEDENGVVFLVMEYLQGHTLKDVIRSEGPMEINRAVEIVRQVAGALDVAHEQGVVHRDLKSDNIMLSHTNGDEWAKVLDFGIAKIQQPAGSRDIDITAPNLVIGTPQYMSPEQCSQSGPLDARSDIYSLGIIVYEMFAGRVPFTGESATAIMMKQVQDPPPAILEARPDLPDGLEKAITKALAKQPVDRFQTAGAFSEALLEATTNPVEAGVALAAPATVPNEPVLAPPRDEVTLVQPADEDEETVVRPRTPPPLIQRDTEVVAAPAAGVSPWRIMIPAAIALVAVFGLVYWLTRGSTPATTSINNSNISQPGIVPDPNSQPVQAVGTPTGDSERNIQSQLTVTPTPTPRPVETNTNQGERIPPAVVNGNFGSNDNSNSNSSNRNRNSNQREAPTPKPKPTMSDEPPPPKPSPTVRVVPKPITTDEPPSR